MLRTAGGRSRSRLAALACQTLLGPLHGIDRRSQSAAIAASVLAPIAGLAIAIATGLARGLGDLAHVAGQFLGVTAAGVACVLEVLSRLLECLVARGLARLLGRLADAPQGRLLGLCRLALGRLVGQTFQLPLVGLRRIRVQGLPDRVNLFGLLHLVGQPLLGLALPLELLHLPLQAIQIGEGPRGRHLRLGQLVGLLLGLLQKGLEFLVGLQFLPDNLDVVLQLLGRLAAASLVAFPGPDRLGLVRRQKQNRAASQQGHRQVADLPPETAAVLDHPRAEPPADLQCLAVDQPAQRTVIALPRQLVGGADPFLQARPEVQVNGCIAQRHRPGQPKGQPQHEGQRNQRQRRPWVGVPLRQNAVGQCTDGHRDHGQAHPVEHQPQAALDRPHGHQPPANLP